MGYQRTNYNHVNYLWDDTRAKDLEGDEIALLLYRSNLLGADLRITNYGGGNTSCKTIEADPLSGEQVEVMWVKGSGGDLGTLNRSGIAGLYTSRLRNLKNVYQGLEDEDRMVDLFNHCIYDLNSKAPSIDTPLHGLLPFKHIDHLHPDALIAIAAAKDSEKITKEIWGKNMGWIPWQRPGFDLGLQLEKCLNEKPGIRGIVLGGHGLFTWGDTAKECYLNSLDVIETASEYIEKEIGSKSTFGGVKTVNLGPKERAALAGKLMPVLRSLCSSERSMIGHFADNQAVMNFVNSHDLHRLAPLGTSCPDHFLRTKIKPLVLELDIDLVGDNIGSLKADLLSEFEQYRTDYAAYYEECKRDNSPAMRDANPVVILVPGLGMFTFAKNKQTARVAAEFYTNAIQVMRGAEAISEYTALPRQEAFDIEYWLLEEAKLQRQPAPKPLSGKVALITGAGGGIGRAIGDKLVSEGACVLFTDLDESRLKDAVATYSADAARYKLLDVTDPESVSESIAEACHAFGGLDIVVHCAGLAISKPLVDTDQSDWELLDNVLSKGQFYLAREAAKIMTQQEMGGNFVSIASKNGLVSGPNNVAYGTAKAAQQHMTRLLAAELGPHGIRVNCVNPDAVIVGSKIWEGEWAEGRAKAYGVPIDELPAFYAKRNLLNEIIYPEDIANAVFALVSTLSKSTGNMINVDGGVANAFVR